MTHPMTAPNEERAAVVRLIKGTIAGLERRQAAHRKGSLLYNQLTGAIFTAETLLFAIERGEHIRKDEGHE